MGVRGSGVRRVKRGSKSRLIIDFYYFDREQRRQRFRKDADVQTMAAARAEADRLRKQAAETGCPVAATSAFADIPTFRVFVKGAWAAIWATRFRRSTLKRYEGLLDQGILKTFGSVRLDEIGIPKLLAYKADLIKAGVQPKHHLSLITSVLRAAVEMQVLPELPKLPKHEKLRRKLPDCPTTEEVNAHLLLARGWLLVAVALAVHAGLRSGEVRAIEVRDIDFKRGMLLVRRAMSEDKVGPTKSGNERLVPISPALSPILAAAIKGKAPTERVIVNAHGRTPSRQHVYTAVRKLQDRHKLQPRSFHSLRHYFCTSLLQRGADVELVRVVAGHEDLKTTARYVHARAEDARRFMREKDPDREEASPAEKNGQLVGNDGEEGSNK